METRVTPVVQSDRQIYYLQQQYATLSNLDQQASSGSKLNQPSDNPIDQVTVLGDNALSGRIDTYLNNISSSTASLNQSVSNLTQVKQILDNAKQLAIQGSNGGNDAATYETLAQQVDALISRTLDLANSQTNGQYLFGGTATGKAPFSVATTNSSGLPQTITYSGSSDQGKTVVGTGQAVATTYSGSQVFQSPGSDVFQALIGLRDTLRNTANLSASAQNQALSQQLGNIANATTSVLGTVGQQSNDLQNLVAIQSRAQNLQTTTKQNISDLQGADIASVLVQVQAETNAYRISLSVAGQLFTNSLVDFIRH